MAARIRKHHTDEIRLKIKTSQLVNLMQDFALTGLDASGNDVSPARLEAAKTLLRKTLPDMTSVEHSGELTTRNVRELSDAELDAAIAEAELASREEEAPSSSGLTH